MIFLGALLHTCRPLKLQKLVVRDVVYCKIMNQCLSGKLMFVTALLSKEKVMLMTTKKCAKLSKINGVVNGTEERKIKFIRPTEMMCDNNGQVVNRK